MTPRPTDLTRAQRAEAMARLRSQPYDVIVVGGGVTGAGVALDAASRGLRTALVEQVDLAAGTSRWSSKLIHGGLRYLARGDLAVAWESSRERRHLMMSIAPHLIRPTEYLLPLDATTSPAMGALAEVGIRFADVLRLASRCPGSLLPRPRRLDRAETLRQAPGMLQEGLRGSLAYVDGQLEDDVRLVVALARTAAAHGADIVTRCSATDLAADGLTLTDQLTGQSLEARGTVISATGVWAADHDATLHIAPSRGSHLVVRAEALGRPKAVVSVPVPGHFGRYVFAMPQSEDIVIIGLTDELAPGVDPIAPPVPPADEEFLLAMISRSLQRPLGPQDVIGRFAGLRPLVVSGRHGADGTAVHAGPSADMSRRHLLIEEPGRPLTIAGGKLTTYRRMAQDAVDAACRRLGRGETCRTATLPLVGAAPREALARVAAPQRLVRRYGTEAPRVLALAERHPELAGPVAPSVAVTGAEMLFGLLAEGAMTNEDLVERRTRTSFVESAVPAAVATAERALVVAASYGDR